MRRYLIVDDNREFAENLAEIVVEAGHRVEVADDGRKALLMATTTRFDAVITDMRMPEMGGADLVRELCAADPEIAMIVITAYTADDDLDRARRFGLLAILPKPVPIARLLELLATAQRTPRDSASTPSNRSGSSATSPKPPAARSGGGRST